MVINNLPRNPPSPSLQYQGDRCRVGHLHVVDRDTRSYDLVGDTRGHVDPGRAARRKCSTGYRPHTERARRDTPASTDRTTSERDKDCLCARQRDQRASRGADRRTDT